VGIVEAIAADHAEAAALFDELVPLARDDRNAKQAMRTVARLAVLVKTHALAEQRVLYEALRTAGDRLAAYAREEPHLIHALDVVLDKVCVLRPGPELEAVVAVARRLFQHHVEREARELLPAVSAELPADEAAQLGHDLEVEKRRLRPRIERQLAR
jgi:hypothetical protein